MAPNGVTVVAADEMRGNKKKKKEKCEEEMPPSFFFPFNLSWRSALLVFRSEITTCRVPTTFCSVFGLSPEDTGRGRHRRQALVYYTAEQMSGFCRKSREQSWNRGKEREADG